MADHIGVLKELETWPHASTQALADQQPQEPPAIAPTNLKQAPAKRTSQKTKKGATVLVVVPEVPHLNSTMGDFCPMMELAPESNARNAGVDFIGNCSF